MTLPTSSYQATRTSHIDSNNEKMRRYSTRTSICIKKMAITTIASCLLLCTSAFCFLPPKHVKPILPPSTRLLNDLPPRFSTTRLLSSNDPDSDTDEWRAMLAALQMYRAAYGNLKVPTKFVVPSMPPWPEPAWGMKLGLRVSAIRSTGKFVQNNEKRKKILDALGFVWQARSTSSKDDENTISFDQLFDALRTYREHIQPVGSLAVPPSFTVPDADPWPKSTRGLQLGRKAPLLRNKSFLQANPEAPAKLASIGFEIDGKLASNDARFQRVYEALVRYKEIFGDLLVPQPFVVPDKSSEWPEELWGLRLGARVNAIRNQGTFVNNSPEKKQLLDKIGFEWSLPQTNRGRRRRTKAEREAEASAEVASMREYLTGGSNGTPISSDSSNNPLESSFDFGMDDEDEDEDDEYDSKDPKLAQAWGAKGGDAAPSKSPTDTTDPADEIMPEILLNETLAEAKAKAIELGLIVPVDDSRGFVKAKGDPGFPWFNDDFGGEFEFEDVVEALTIYKSMYGNFSNLTSNDDFVIPVKGDMLSTFDESDDDDYGIGVASRAAVAVASYRESKGVSSAEELISAEIERLQEDVEVSRPVSDSTVVWPDHLAGMALGNIVRRIRSGALEVKHLPERKAQLDAIDFDWGNPRHFIDVPFEKAMCAMLAYYLIRGDMLVSKEFVMPDSDPWPEVLAGYELGKAVHRIRDLQYRFQMFHPDMYRLLWSVEFYWNPPEDLPQDPEDPPYPAETVMLAALGHPCYYHLSDPPLGMPEKILEAGPVCQPEDPIDWWREWYDWDRVKDVWYERGRRDNAYDLRYMGFHQMADEHEAKYGPGFYHEVNETLVELNETLAELEGGVDDMSDEEFSQIVEKLRYYQEEFLDCDFAGDFPYRLATQVNDTLIEFLGEDDDGEEEEEEEEGDNGDTEPDQDSNEEEYYEQEEYEEGEEYEYEYEEEEEEEIVEATGEEEMTEEEDEEEIIEEEELDINDELGLDLPTEPATDRS